MKAKFYLFLVCFFFSLSLSAQRVSTMVMESWTNGAWKYDMRSTYTYDSNGNLTKNVGDTWTPTTWEKSTQTLNTLNADNTVNFSLFQMWNNTKGLYEDAQKTIYTYDASKNVLTSKTQVLLGTIWADFSIATYTYTSGQLTKTVSQALDFTTMQMKNSSQVTYTYNGDGTQNQSVNSIPSAVPGQWDFALRSTNTYNSSKKVTSTLTEEYKSNAWVNKSKTTINYNADGSTKDVLDQTWSGTTWVDDSKAIFTNYGNGTVYQMVSQDWVVAQSQWVNQLRITYTYTTTSVIQPELAGSQIKIYPNPFTNIVTIENNAPDKSEIYFYNTGGQLVKSFVKQQSVSRINMSDLTKGTYLVKVVTPGSEQVVKLIKVE